MEHQALLKSLGGPHAVHALLTERGVTITPVSVRAWALTPRRIPAKYWAYIIDIAAQKGVSVDFEQLAKTVALPVESQAA